MRFEYRITKYNPKFRNAKGHYIPDEWTYFDQVGTRIAGRVLTMKEYLQTESAYLKVLEAILTEADISQLKIRLHYGIVPKRLAHWKRRKKITVPLAVKLARLALREKLGGTLTSPYRFRLNFGWDYYMNVGLSRPTPKAFIVASKLGLFVEQINHKK